MKTTEKLRKKPRNANRKAVYASLILYIGIHLAFAFSGLIRDENKYAVSAFREPQELSSTKSISLIRWDCAPDDKVMEIVFDIQDSAYSKGNIEFSATCEEENLDSEIVYSEEDMLVLQLYGVPKKYGQCITLTFEYAEAGTTNKVSFYNYTGIVNEVVSLPVRSKEEYYIDRQEIDIAYYTDLVEKSENSIAQKESSISEIEAETEMLRRQDETLTTDEMLNLQQRIENNNDYVASLKTQIEDIRISIAGYEEVIRVLEERKAKYE